MWSVITYIYTKLPWLPEPDPLAAVPPDPVPSGA